MIKLSRRLFLVVLSLVMILFAIPINSSAVQIDYHEVVVGDIITYEIHAGNCPKDIYALDVSIYYDNDALEIVEDSFYLPSITGYVANTDLDGEIRFNAVTLEGFQFQPDKILATVKFRVISDYNPYPVLKYEVKNFIDIDYIDYLEAYTYDLTYVNEDFSSIEDVNSQIDSNLSDTETDSDSNINSDTDNLDTETETNTDNETEKDVNTDLVTPSQNSVNEIIKDKSTDLQNKATPDSVVTRDSVSPSANRTNIYVIIAVAICAVIIIAVLFIIIKKSSHTGSHMKK